MSVSRVPQAAWSHRVAVVCLAVAVGLAAAF